MADPALDALIDALRCLPGVGQKSAQRMAFHLLQHDRPGAVKLARSLDTAVSEIGHCQRCHTFSRAEVCDVCLDGTRDPHLLCVVETPADQAALERTGSYKGQYFVLLGRLSPLDGLGARDIGLSALIERAIYNARASRIHLMRAERQQIRIELRRLIALGVLLRKF